jgi:aspartyl protease family protein
LKHTIRLIASLALLPLCAEAQMYKCVRADGTIAYQDAACPAGAQSKTIAAAAPKSSSTLLMTPDARGHYHARISINDVEVDGLIDTGATNITLSAATATTMNISGSGGKAAMMRTANGVVPIYSTVVNRIKIGDIELFNIAVAITENSPTLIGMSALSRFKITQDSGQMILEKR